MSKKHAFWGLLIMVALLLAVPVALAQDEETIELVGEITDMGDTTITVNSLVVDVSAAEVSATLEVGVTVKVEGVLLEDGSVEASKVESVDEVPEESEFTGELTEYAPGETAVVSGLTFDVSAADVPADLAVGERVTVYASLTDEGWVASKIERVSDDDEDVGEDSGDDMGEDEDEAGDDDSGSDDDDASGACTLEVKSESAGLRTGPGPGYDVVGYAFDDQTLGVTGSDDSGAWLSMEDGSWIAASVGELHGDCSGLSVSDLPYQSGDDSQGEDHSGDDSHEDDHSSDDSHEDDHGSDDSHEDDHSSDDSHEDDHSSDDDHMS